MPIKIVKHARHYPEKDDGIRLLVTRWWPRGVTKQSVDNWLPVLAPSATLLRAYRDDDLLPKVLNPVQNSEDAKFKVFTGLYLEEMQSAESQLCIRGLAQELEVGATLTLLCACHATTYCHRTILKTLIENYMEKHHD